MDLSLSTGALALFWGSLFSNFLWYLLLTQGQPKNNIGLD
jgi:hypothetical protein